MKMIQASPIPRAKGNARHIRIMPLWAYWPMSTYKDLLYIDKCCTSPPRIKVLRHVEYWSVPVDQPQPTYETITSSFMIFFKKK